MIILRTLGVLFLLLGFLTSLFPMIPTGLIFLVIGVALLASTNRRVANYIRGLRKKYPNLDRKVDQVEEILPKILRCLLKRTRPKSGKNCN